MRIKLSDCPPALRERIAKALESVNARQGTVLASQESTGTKSLPDQLERNSKPIRAKRTQTKTEQSYNRECLSGKGRFEAITFLLPGGSRYTPDFVTVDGDRITLHEVKGRYRLGSQGRALTAFKEAASHWPMFDWIWATRTETGWETRMVEK